MINLATVCDTANASGADLFISIHCNAADSAAALGTETYCYPGSTAGEMLAKAVQRQIVDSLHTVDRGVKLAIPGQKRAVRAKQYIYAGNPRGARVYQQ